MADQLPAGYRQGLITSITVVLTASFVFFTFMAVNPQSGNWTRWGAACVGFAALAILMLLYALWRALQPRDEHLPVYSVTLRWFASGVVVLLLSFASGVVANVVY